MLKVYVGTSGWSYSWNPDGFEWYVRNSGLNAVELNASFYRFPFRNQVLGWRRRSGERIRWAIKVNNIITHRLKMGGRSVEVWERFRRIFEPLDELIDFYLFQLPPSIKPTDKFMERLQDFVRATKLGERFALEGRRDGWFEPWFEKWCEEVGMVPVSVDAPELPRVILKARDTVYLRMHGREYWYDHYYADEELKEVVKKIVEARPKRCYVFFNNDTNMLRNASTMLSLFLGNE